MGKNQFEIVKDNGELEANQVASSDEARAIQEVQASLVIAKRFPRDQRESMDRVLTACTRPSLAAAAVYSYSRGGAEVTGPTIRLAEAVAQAWGNISFGTRELSNSGGSSVVEAFAWDLETNTKQTRVFIVKHERHSRRGKKDLTDPRDIYETVANNGARRLRACLLGVIPGDVIEGAVEQCEETFRAEVDMSPEGLKKVLAAFGAIGVSASQVEVRTQCRFESVRPAQVVALRKIFQSIKEGMSTADDWFDRESLDDMMAKAKPVKAKPKAAAEAGAKKSGLKTEGF